MKLYGCKGCGSAAVEVILQLADVEYEFVDAIQWTPYQRHADLERINSLGQVPVLVFDDGSVMTESAAMMLYFAEKVPGMIPTEAAARAAFYRWMIFVPANMYAVFAFRDFPQRWVDGEALQVAFRDKTTERLKEYWRLLESELQPQPYLLGAAISALDIYVAMLSKWSPGRQWIRDNCPKLISAVDKTEQHPVVKAVWEKNFG
jgi:GST-like protein